MSKHIRSQSSRTGTAAREMLEGRGRPDLGRLVALIREVNPTARALPADEERSRYATKSALQSLLIRHFAADLRVTPDARDPDLYLLEHSHLDLEACHTRLDTLDDYARSWLRLQLDLGPSEIESGANAGRRIESQRATFTSTAELRLADGMRAVAEFEYDVARGHFEVALDASDGALTPARALLELLVDTLAAYSDALSLEERIGASARSHIAVRGLLAIAAARCVVTRNARSAIWMNPSRLAPVTYSRRWRRLLCTKSARSKPSS